MTEPTPIPPAVLEALRRAESPDGGPQPRELWRARDPDGHTASLLLVRAVDDDGVHGVTVTFDIEPASAHTWVVDDDRSPLGIALAVHESWPVSLAMADMIDRLGSIDDGGGGAGVGVTPPLDESALDRWWPLAQPPSAVAELIFALSAELSETRPAARVVPRADGIALVAEMDAFVLVAAGEPSLERAHRMLQSDSLLNAVCLVDMAEPFDAVVIDRRDVVDAIETPSGQLRPPRQSRAAMPVGPALAKYLDSAISPFGRLAATVVEAQGIDPRDLAVDAASEAVRGVEASAKGFKVEGKRPGYERVGRHKLSIIRLIESAMADPSVDVEALLEGGDE